MKIRFIGWHIPGIARMYALSLLPKLSNQAKKRLAWIDYYYDHQKDAYLTARYFGIAPKTLYKWLKRFNPKNLASLEEESRAPIQRRTPTITSLQEQRIIELRKQHMMYGKMKLAILYRNEYHTIISSWHIQRVITKWKLYPNRKKNETIQVKRKRSGKKKRIQALTKKSYPFFLFALDTIEVRIQGLRRYIFTAIDRASKLAYARMYKSKSSFAARDFLLRLLFLTDHQLLNLGMDNGSEWAKYFQEACALLGIEQYFSRVRTPKDNPVNERFNQTLEYEFLFQGNVTPHIHEFNQRLSEWLIEYNFRRPHQSLDYLTPIEYTCNHTKLLPMYPSRTFS